MSSKGLQIGFEFSQYHDFESSDPILEYIRKKVKLFDVFRVSFTGSEWKTRFHCSR